MTQTVVSGLPYFYRAGNKHVQSRRIITEAQSSYKGSQWKASLSATISKLKGLLQESVVHSNGG